jgi:adenylate cyclase
MHKQTSQTAPAIAPAPAKSAKPLHPMLRQIGVGRLILTTLFLLLALVFARYSWSVPLADSVERYFYDLRAAFNMPRSEQDRRITMIVYDDQTRIETGRISPLDRLILARALERVDRLGAKSIGIDMLIDQATPEDPALVAAFKAMRTPVWLGFATYATNPDNMPLEREQFLRAFLNDLKGSQVRATSIRLLPDPDDVMRNWPDQPKTLPRLLPISMAGERPGFDNYQGPIRFRAPLYEDQPVFNELTLQFITNPAIPDEVLRPMIEGRYIMIGGKLPDVDRFKTPETVITDDSTAGLEVHAHLLAQLLDGWTYRTLPSWPLWPVAILFVAAGVLTSILNLRPWAVALIVLGMLAAALVGPWWLQSRAIDTQDMPVFGWLGGWALAFVVASAAARSVGAEQRRIAQSALGKYLPRDIANEIIRDPDRLALHGEKREIYALFSDLEGFTKLSHAIEPEMVAFLLNRYLDILSETVLKYGGTIDKFVGDAIVAFWGAPISRPDDPDHAVQAARAIYEAGERFRREAPEGVPPIGCTRVGLHRGDAIVGNFGGEGRIQYTALGDSMNLAARLESANKQLKTTVLVTDAVVERSTLGYFRPMGRVAVRGRATPIAIYEPVPNLSAEDVTLLTALVERFDKGDAQALAELESYSAGHPEDAAVANLVYRLRQSGPGGSFVLE